MKIASRVACQGHTARRVTRAFVEPHIFSLPPAHASEKHSDSDEAQLRISALPGAPYRMDAVDVPPRLARSLWGARSSSIWRTYVDAAKDGSLVTM